MYALTAGPSRLLSACALALAVSVGAQGSFSAVCSCLRQHGHVLPFSSQLFMHLTWNGWLQPLNTYPMSSASNSTWQMAHIGTSSSSAVLLPSKIVLSSNESRRAAAECAGFFPFFTLAMSTCAMSRASCPITPVQFAIFHVVPNTAVITATGGDAAHTADISCVARGGCATAASSGTASPRSRARSKKERSWSRPFAIRFNLFLSENGMTE
mmetsp:Transcript_57767/g.135879  ORF Transcript_57767/g.135879 Transcript_57767/m.135879 type:complete len:212 (-) Transcript_57767:148-783(-)